MALYRGQTTTQQKIQAISTLNITTKEEAIGFLRAISNINLQIAQVLQRENIKDLARRNSSPAVVAEPVYQETVATPEEPVAPIVEEEHTEDQKKVRVAKLKKALEK